MSNKTPDHQLPTVREGTTLGVRLPIPAWWVIVSSLVLFGFGSGCWATWVSAKLEKLQDAVSEIREELKEQRSNKVSKNAL